MSFEHPTELTRALARLGYSSVSDLFLDRPALHLWTAPALLSDASCQFAPIDFERALKAECERRADLHFFARVALFTALHSFDGIGWGSQHYMLGGTFGGILRESADEHRRACWAHLQSLNLPDGWKPASLFDPILEAALNAGFPSHHLSHAIDRNA